MKYSGIDLHSNNNVVAVIDEEDRVVAERRLPNDLARIVGFLDPWRSELVAVVVESTYNWYWLVDGLQAAGFEVKLASTGAIKRYEGLKRSGDEADARYLAHLLRLGILPTGYICPPRERGLRDLARRRLQLVRSRTAQILSVENQLTRQTGGRMRSNDVKRLTPAAVYALGLPHEVACGMAANVAVIQTLNAEIERLEVRLGEGVSRSADWRLLKTAPGVGEILATTILLETGPIGRFAEVGRFASYARCVDSVRVSNGKKKGEGNAKNGNKYLAWAFVEAAHFAARFCPQAKRFYARKHAQTNGAVATKALAHKLARACYHTLKRGEPFDLERCFAG
ncbi:MAG: IS110 family transposase [Betaproteobacteria bacterium]|nr:IS110 family transposase [Betaproteobacteria bacterium]